MFEKEVQALHQGLLDHPIYTHLNSAQNVKIFTQYHCFAVWDFMTLLKALQQRVTCIYLPWYPSPYPAEAVRFINEIVLNEESDLDRRGRARSHFEIYLEAMEEISADTRAIRNFLRDGDLSALPIGVKEFVKFHIDLAFNGTDEEVAAALFLGREKLVPKMYAKIRHALLSNKIKCETLDFYLQREIDIGGTAHAPFANVCFELICGNSKEKRNRAQNIARVSLQMRDLLWNAALEAIQAQGGQQKPTLKLA